VRNLDSCIKVAVDFVSPHNLALCLHMAREVRAWRDPEERVSWGAEEALSNEDRLAAETILLHSVRCMMQHVQDKLEECRQGRCTARDDQRWDACGGGPHCSP